MFKFVVNNDKILYKKSIEIMEKIKYMIKRFNSKIFYMLEVRIKFFYN